MDDTYYEKWTETLAALRKERSGLVASELKLRSSSFSPRDFWDIVSRSLQNASAQWWSLEQASGQEFPPGDVDERIRTSREEIESIIDFEIESARGELLLARNETAWSDRDVKKGEMEFLKFADELKRAYAVKLQNFYRPKSEPSKVQETVRRDVAGTGGGSSGSGLIGMLILGVILGGGASAYFWDVARKTEIRHQDERTALLADKRMLQDSLSIYRETLTQFAQGKIQNIPEIEGQIAAIQREARSQVTATEREFARRREAVLKRLPAGSALDEALRGLDAQREDALAKIHAGARAKMAPLQKELERLKDLIGV